MTSGQQGTVMPEAGSVVTCRVLSVNPSQATVSIICVGPNKLHTPVSGTVRKQNVRDHQIDTVSHLIQDQWEELKCILLLHWPKHCKVTEHESDPFLFFLLQVEMYNCFRPDDIILAVVMSLGDLRNYELSTAGTELGVVTACCEEGHPLVPASWTTMKCKCRVEKRKVAKVMPPKTWTVVFSWAISTVRFLYK